MVRNSSSRPVERATDYRSEERLSRRLSVREDSTKPREEMLGFSHPGADLIFGELDQTLVVRFLAAVEKGVVQICQFDRDQPTSGEFPIEKASNTRMTVDSEVPFKEYHGNGVKAGIVKAVDACIPMPGVGHHFRFLVGCVGSLLPEAQEDCSLFTHSF